MGSRRSDALFTSHLTPLTSHLPPMRLALLAITLWLPGRATAQDPRTVPSGPPLSPFVALRVALVPVQLWRADSTGWSRSVTWSETRLALDSAVQAVLQERGLGKKWAYASDVVRSAKRNPTYASDPYSLGTGRWRGLPPEPGALIPDLLADNLRSVTALGDTRYALVPVEIHAQGDGVVLRLVMADTRTRTVVWVGDLLAPGGAGMIGGLATRVADLVIEP